MSDRKWPIIIWPEVSNTWRWIWNSDIYLNILNNTSWIPPEWRNLWEINDQIVVRRSSWDDRPSPSSVEPGDWYYPNKAEYSWIFRKDKIAHLVHSQYGTEVFKIVQRSYKDRTKIFARSLFSTYHLIKNYLLLKVELFFLRIFRAEMLSRRHQRNELIVLLEQSVFGLKYFDGLYLEKKLHFQVNWDQERSKKGKIGGKTYQVEKVKHFLPILWALRWRHRHF